MRNHMMETYVEQEKEIIQLKDLNREMVAALKMVSTNYYDDYTLPRSVVLHVRKVLQTAKAGAGQGE